MGARDILPATGKGKTHDVGGIELRLRRILQGAGGQNSLTYGVLSMVINQSYGHASKEIDLYLELKSEYPELLVFTKRYVERCKHLMGEIESKRDMPGMDLLSMAKIQVINDSIVSNFESLKDTLKKIEKVEYNQRMTDLRSTLIFVRTFAWCVLAIILLAFVMEIYNGLYSTTGAVADEMITDAVDWAFNRIGG